MSDIGMNQNDIQYVGDKVKKLVIDVSNMEADMKELKEMVIELYKKFYVIEGGNDNIDEFWK